MNKLNGRRIAYTLSIGTVAGVAAFGSYSHMHDVAVLGHQAELLARALPLSVDGMLLVATLAMAEDKANHRYPRAWARFAFWLGAVVSVAANIAATAAHYGDPLSIAVSIWPPVALLVVVEMMARPGRAKATTDAVVQLAAQVLTPATMSAPSTVSAPAAVAARAPRVRTVTANVPATLTNPRTGQPYSERHTRRLVNGR